MILQIQVHIVEYSIYIYIYISYIFASYSTYIYHIYIVDDIYIFIQYITSLTYHSFMHNSLNFMYSSVTVLY
jgi:hypothetical protein